MFFFIASILLLDFPYFCSSHYQGGETSEKKGQKILAYGSHSLALEPHQNEEKGPDFLQFINSWFLYHSEVPIDTTLNQCSGGYPHLKLSSFNISRLTFLGFPQQVDIASKKFICLLCEVIYQFGGLELNQIQFSYLVDLILHFWRAWLVYSRVKLKPWKGKNFTKRLFHFVSDRGHKLYVRSFMYKNFEVYYLTLRYTISLCIDVLCLPERSKQIISQLSMSWFCALYILCILESKYSIK